jgi:hypothetical protein
MIMCKSNEFVKYGDYVYLKKKPLLSEGKGIKAGVPCGLRASRLATHIRF